MTMRPVNESQKVTEAVRTDPALWGRKNKTLGSPRGCTGDLDSARRSWTLSCTNLNYTTFLGW